MDSIKKLLDAGIPFKTRRVMVTQKRMENLHRKGLQPNLGVNASICIIDDEGRLFVNKHVALGEKARQAGFSERYVKGMWDVPGGWARKEEGLEEAAVREFREETGLLIHPTNVCGVIIWRVESPDGGVFEIYDANLNAKIIGGTLSLNPDEVETARFLSLKDIKALVEQGEAEETLITRYYWSKTPCNLKTNRSSAI
ncbi:MAG: NUDIX hydrolase [Candidatus Bathyarchaeota archaeon]|nr:NUDIX hydrolase [Candidatus Bathyarchaeota archaeon]